VIRNALSIVLIVVCVLVFAFSAWQLIKYYYANHEAEQSFAVIRPPQEVADESGGTREPTYEDLLPSYKVLKETNEDFVAWLKVPGTNIDYPVMQTLWSPEYYIDKDFNKKYSASGCLFASELSDLDLPSDAVLIYGHHMKTGAMFGTMGDFLEQDYFDAHRTVILDTLERRYEYTVYGLFKTQVYTEDPNEFQYYGKTYFATPDEFTRFMAEINGRLQISDPSAAPQYGDKFIMLSTCEYSQENGRLVLVAVLR